MDAANLRLPLAFSTMLLQERYVPSGLGCFTHDLKDKDIYSLTCQSYELPVIEVSKTSIHRAESFEVGGQTYRRDGDRGNSRRGYICSDSSSNRAF